MKEEDGGKGEGRLKGNKVVCYVVCIMALECSQFNALTGNNSEKLAL